MRLPPSPEPKHITHVHGAHACDRKTITDHRNTLLRCRDSFQNVVELLDDMFQRAAAADEPEEENYVRKHCAELRAGSDNGVDVGNAAARLFSNPAGDYGSMVNERVGASNWTSSQVRAPHGLRAACCDIGRRTATWSEALSLRCRYPHHTVDANAWTACPQELGDTWASRNAFSYGRGDERGAARPDVLRQLLSTTDRVVQQVDSVEYGLTDIQARPPPSCPLAALLGLPSRNQS